MMAKAAADESIYNLLPQHQAAVGKEKRYRSKHSGYIDPHEFEMGIKEVQGHSTFGKPDGYNSAFPDTFTRAHTGEFHQTRKGAGVTPPKMRLKDPLPDRHSPPVMGLKSDKDFTVTNALDVIKAKPTVPEPEFDYTQKPDFGKVPEYLLKAKREQEEAMAARAAREQLQIAEDNKVAPLSEDTRQELLAHLKTKWAEVNTTYQKLPFSVDSASKRARKEGLERELQSIEADIRLLQRGNILVAQDA